MQDKSIKVKYLSYEQLGEEAYKILRKFNCETIIPVPVEKLIDNEYQINIFPFPNLFKTFDINAITSIDLKIIYVDEYSYKNLEEAYRFTLAHELGHIILHKKIYVRFSINSIEDWRNFIINVEEREYEYLEIQANNFAGHFLVPHKLLEKYFKIELSKLIKKISSSNFKALRREDYLDVAVSLISSRLSPIFRVSRQVIKIRLEKSHLIGQIP